MYRCARARVYMCTSVSALLFEILEFEQPERLGLAVADFPLLVLYIYNSASVMPIAVLHIGL